VAVVAQTPSTAELVNLVDVPGVFLVQPLVDFDLDAHPVLSLADELEASSDAMKWTIRVKPDIEFHNGKTLSADDVLFTFQRIVSPKTPHLVPYRSKPSTLPTRRRSTSTQSRSRASRRSHRCGHSRLVRLLRRAGGLRPEAPDRHRSFKYESFTAGQQSTFVKNKNYWESGLPYIDRLVISDLPTR